MHKFFLTRHGESLANKGRATYNPKDAELTTLGYKQAWQAGKYLQKYPDLYLKRIVTSAYLRTKQTAEPTKKLLPYSFVEEEWKVQEFTYLSPAYLGYSNTDYRRPLVDAYWDMCDPHYFDGHDSESFSVFIGRVRAFIRRLKVTRENIAVFSHEQFIDAVLWLLQYKPDEISPRAMREFRAFFKSHRIPNGAIVEITVRNIQDRPDAWETELITSHLKHTLPEPKPPSRYFATVGAGELITAK